MIMADIHRAFMQADMDEVVHIHLEGKTAKLMIKLDSTTYEPYPYDITRRQSYTQSFSKHYMECFGVPSCFGKYAEDVSRNGGSKSTHMILVWQTS